MSLPTAELFIEDMQARGVYSQEMKRLTVKAYPASGSSSAAGGLRYRTSGSGIGSNSRNRFQSVTAGPLSRLSGPRYVRHTLIAGGSATQNITRSPKRFPVTDRPSEDHLHVLTH
jgi:hypothetical protein